MKTFKVLSALLTYPSQDLIAAAPEFAGVLDSENLVPAAQRDAARWLDRGNRNR
jgi:nitrate reductase delta subunit